MHVKAIVILTAVFLAEAGLAAEPPSREELWSVVSEAAAKVRDAEERLLAPDVRDVEASAGFLAEPNTGLVRLLPRERGEKALALRGGGAYYSFSRRTHVYGRGSDIELSNGVLRSGFAGADFGFFEDTGEISLEEITSDHPAVSGLAALLIPTTLSGAREAQSSSPYGATPGRRPVREMRAMYERCYVLRSVNYSSSDVLVAFRVVRIDEDGSVTLLWRILKDFPTPNLKG